MGELASRIWIPLLAVFASLVGSLTTGFFSLQESDQDLRHEDQRRFSQLAFEAAEELISLTDEDNRTIGAYIAAVEGGNVEEAIRLLRQSREKLDELERPIRRLVLAGAPEVSRAAHEVLEAKVAYSTAAFQSDSYPQELYEKYRESRNDFVSTFRRSIGMEAFRLPGTPTTTSR